MRIIKEYAGSCQPCAGCAILVNQASRKYSPDPPSEHHKVSQTSRDYLVFYEDQSLAIDTIYINNTRNRNSPAFSIFEHINHKISRKTTNDKAYRDGIYSRSR